MVMAAIRDWIERQTGHESPSVEREMIDAEREDVLQLIARLDAAERRLKDKRLRNRNDAE